MAKDRDAWVYALSVAVASLLFGIASFIENFSAAVLLSTLLTLFVFLVVSGVGYFIGQKISKQHSSIKYLIFGGLLSVVLTNNTVRLFGVGAEQPYLLFLIMFGISILIGWRLPLMEKKKIES